MRSVLLSAMRYVGYPAGRALAIYGQVFGPLVPPPYFPLPPQDLPPAPEQLPPEPRAAALVWDGPAPGHPERLRPDLPFSRAEIGLLRQLGAEPRRS